MPRFKPKGVLERNAGGDLWKRTLSRIPTLYGRITYLASLRDSNSGIYRHHGLAQVFGREESGKALRESHELAFYEWINLRLSERNDDLVQYLEDLDDPVPMVVDYLLKSKIYRAQVPNCARKMEEELFCNDLEALLETLRNESSAGGFEAERHPDMGNLPKYFNF